MSPHTEDEPRSARKRHSDRLLTIDRALLAGIFVAGAWYATTDLRAGNVLERVQAIERREEQLRDRNNDLQIEHAREYATMTQRLNEIDRRTENIEKGLTAIAESTARILRQRDEQQ